jgi:hypothetical protein
MNYIRKHSLLGKSIKLEDQSFNQRLAQEALQRDLITLDLSNASDTVSTALVWYLFSGVPAIRRRLMATRSDFLCYKDRQIRISSFAPMGSAVCFPIETLVFWSISLASIMQARSHDRFRSSPYELSADLAVFGDDIIIPAYAWPTLCSTLISVGCTPNMSKTCIDTPFRESCGSEWYAGIDVTIPRNRLYQYSSDRKFIDYPVLLGLQRKLFLKGCYSAADLLKQWAGEIWPVATLSVESLRFIKPPYISLRDILTAKCSHKLDMQRSCRSRDLDYETEVSKLGYFERQELAIDSFPCAIGLYEDISSNLPYRYNRDYQRYEIRVPIEINPSRPWRREGYPRLMARLLSDRIERIAIRRRKTKMAWAYVPMTCLSTGH